MSLEIEDKIIVLSQKISPETLNNLKKLHFSKDVFFWMSPLRDWLVRALEKGKKKLDIASYLIAHRQAIPKLLDPPLFLWVCIFLGAAGLEIPEVIKGLHQDVAFKIKQIRSWQPQSVTPFVDYYNYYRTIGPPTSSIKGQKGPLTEDELYEEEDLKNSRDVVECDIAEKDKEIILSLPMENETIKSPTIKDAINQALLEMQKEARQTPNGEFKGASMILVNSFIKILNLDFEKAQSLSGNYMKRLKQQGVIVLVERKGICGYWQLTEESYHHRQLDQLTQKTHQPGRAGRGFQPSLKTITETVKLCDIAKRQGGILLGFNHVKNDYRANLDEFRYFVDKFTRKGNPFTILIGKKQNGRTGRYVINYRALKEAGYLPDDYKIPDELERETTLLMIVAKMAFLTKNQKGEIRNYQQLFSRYGFEELIFKAALEKLIQQKILSPIDDNSFDFDYEMAQKLGYFDLA